MTLRNARKGKAKTQVNHDISVSSCRYTKIRGGGLGSTLDSGVSVQLFGEHANFTCTSI